MKRLVYIFYGVLMLMLSVVSAVHAVGVQPMEIKITGKPGTTVPFKFTVLSTEKNPAKINLSLAQTVQLPNGALDFKPSNPELLSEVKWIRLNNLAELIPTGGEKEISGTVKIPSDARGFHLVSIMVEQPPAQKTQGLNLSVIYAVKLEINIDTIVPRPIAQVTDFEMVQGAKMEPCLQFKVKNPSITPFSTNASVSIRNILTKKLIEKVELRPAFYWQNRYEPVVLPDSIVQFMGIPKTTLLPGKYDLQLFFRYAASGQVLLSKTIEVKAGDYVYPVEKLRLTQITPDNIRLTGKPGTTAVKGIKFENRSDKPVKIILKPMNISTDYLYSIFKNAVVEVKNGRELYIEPGRMAVAVISVKLPKDASAQGNYGLLRVFTFNTDDNPDPIEQSEIILEAVIPGKYTLTAETTDLSATRDGEKILLSAIIKNTGNIKIAPQCTMLLKDKNGKIIDTVILAAQGDNDSVLPMKLMTLSGNTNKKLTPNNYKAEIEIMQENIVIGSSVMDLQVK